MGSNFVLVSWKEARSLAGIFAQEATELPGCSMATNNIARVKGLYSLQMRFRVVLGNPEGIFAYDTAKALPRSFSHWPAY
jgi:hypothetical protein